MTELDLRRLSPREHNTALFASFDQLAPAKAVELVVDRDPAPLLHAFQQERAGAYEWSWLEDGPELWRARIARRPVLRVGVQTVSDLLGSDHDRLDVLFLAARQAWAAGDLRAAGKQFAAFAVGLRRHIQAEDAVLFPAFEQNTGHSPAAGPTAVMRAEHREIEELLESIGRALESGTERECREMGGLAALLLAHNRKEEHVLYPLTDRALAPEARAALCRSVEAA